MLFSEKKAVRGAAALALLGLTAGAPAAPDGAAKLTRLQPGTPPFAAPPAQALGTLETLFDKRRDDGSTLHVWRYATHYGECAGDDQLGAAEDPTCPSDALLVSVWRDEERSSTFALWGGSKRRAWAVASATKPEGVALQACEAVGGHMRRRLGYTLIVAADLTPRLQRDPVSGAEPTC